MRKCFDYEIMLENIHFHNLISEDVECKYCTPAGVCCSRLGCAQEVVQGEGKREEGEEEQACFRGGLREVAIKEGSQNKTSLLLGRV